MAKRSLVGLKEGALRQLVDQGVIVEPITRTLHESVLPWLIEKMSGFLEDEEDIDVNVEELVHVAYQKGLDAHAKSIIGERRRKEDLIYSAEQRII